MSGIATSAAPCTRVEKEGSGALSEREPRLNNDGLDFNSAGGGFCATSSAAGSRVAPEAVRSIRRLLGAPIQKAGAARTRAVG